MWISVDVEADGPIPGDYSMTEIGAVIIQQNGEIGPTFYGKLRPISDKWIPQALAVSGKTREETLEFDNPADVMAAFAEWIREYNGKGPRFIADNNGFDWMFTCWYFWHFTGGCPFGFSSDNLNSIYKGATGSLRASFKHLRDTPHDHNPVNDAISNAEATVKIARKYGIRLMR